MSTPNTYQINLIQLKRGDTAKASQYVGEPGELVVDTDLKTVRVQDAETPGGILLAKASHIHAQSEVIGLVDALELKAPVESPQLTGHPTAPFFDPSSPDDQIVNRSEMLAALAGGTSGNAASASKLATGRVISLTGDVQVLLPAFDGTKNITAEAVLRNTGVVPGWYGYSEDVLIPFRVDASGRIVDIDTPQPIRLDFSRIYELPSTLEGYGIDDAQKFIAPGEPNEFYRGDKSWAALNRHVVGLSNVENVTLSTWAGSEALTTAGDLTVKSLNVTGTTVFHGETTLINSEKIVLNDPVLTLGGESPVTIDDGVDRGIEFNYNDGTASKTGFFGFNRSSGKFTFIPDATNVAEVFTGDVGAIEANLDGNAASASKLETERNIAMTGDGTWQVAFDGSGDATGALTLAPTGVVAGTYNASATSVRPLVFDEKGRLTGVGAPVTVTPMFASVTNRPTTLAGYGILDAAPSIHQHSLQIGDGSAEKITFATNERLDIVAGSNIAISYNDATNRITIQTEANLSANAATATKLGIARTIASSGDVVWSTSFDGSANSTGIATLSDTGVAANIYNNNAASVRPLEFDSKGRLVSVGDAIAITIPFSRVQLRPTTLAGYGIGDAEPKLEPGSNGTFFAGDKTWKAVSKSNVGLGDVENVALSTWTGSTALSRGGDMTVDSLIVTGNAVFQGDSTIVNSTSIHLQDPVITLGVVTSGNGEDVPDGKCRGIEFTYSGEGPETGFFGFDPTQGAFVFLTNATNSNDYFTGNSAAIIATLIGNVIGDVEGNANTATAASTADRLSIPRNISMSGDGTWSTSFSGASSSTGAMTLASVVNPGTYGGAGRALSITLDSKGRVTSASADLITLNWTSGITNKPTTLAGYGITDAGNPTLVDVTPSAMWAAVQKNDSGSMLTNRNATQEMVYQLPAAASVIGVSFTFFKVNANSFKIMTTNSERIMDGTVLVNNVTTELASSVRVISIAGNATEAAKWVITSGFGTWQTS